MRASDSWPRAVVFDLDGTLIDSAPDIAGALNRLLVERGIKALPIAEVAALVGDGAAVLVKRGFRAAAAPLDAADLPEALTRFQALYAKYPVLDTVPYIGVPELIDGLVAEGRRIAICTNKPGHLTDLVLADLGWAGRFHAVIGGDGPAGRKPDPGSLKEILRRLEIDPADAVMVGDSVNDVKAARGAGCPIIVAGYGYCHADPATLGGDVVITRPSELGPALTALRR